MVRNLDPALTPEAARANTAMIQRALIAVAVPYIIIGSRGLVSRS